LINEKSDDQWYTTDNIFFLDEEFFEKIERIEMETRENSTKELITFDDFEQKLALIRENNKSKKDLYKRESTNSIPEKKKRSTIFEKKESTSHIATSRRSSTENKVDFCNEEKEKIFEFVLNEKIDNLIFDGKKN
jgi:hypothetical protein